mmetsp:Transcript_20359/g.43103  ORF Transcript_20359/g.43103 Transcript_20359/m.43103 type:complete len:464 (-) Transcript_20359:366-1757(-)
MSKRDEEAAAGGGSGGDASATVSEDSGDAITDMCVLLVEDDTVARKCAEAALRSCGYRVIAAQNGREALDILKSNEAEKIDMILTDILMPEVSGLQLLDNVVHSDKWKKLPVTVMSSQDSIDTAAKCIQKGAVEFLAKPVRKHKLTNLWQHVLRRKAEKEEGSVANEEEEGTESPRSTTQRRAAGAGAATNINGSGGSATTNASPGAMAAAVPQVAVPQAVNNNALAAQLAAGLANPALIPTWASQLPQAIVEIAFRPSGDQMGVVPPSPATTAAVAQAAADNAAQLHHSNSCSAFSAFIRCRENEKGGANKASTSGTNGGGGNMMSFAANTSQLAAQMTAMNGLPPPLQVSNLNIVQHSGQGGFRGSGMLMVQDLQSMKSGTEAASERRAEAIRKFREKKKARTFKKKVRYESRKRLAEARPRIKGQFVRPEVAAAAAAAAAAAGVAAAAAAKAEGVATEAA